MGPWMGQEEIMEAPWKKQKGQQHAVLQQPSNNEEKDWE